MSQFTHGCHHCGTAFQAEDLGPYTSRQLCPPCREQHGQRWLQAQAERAAHTHDWQPRGSNRACACGAMLVGSGVDA